MDRQPPIIYNLFPTLAGPLEVWHAHAERARAMGFDWIYLNPVHYPGFSGSLYAVKEYDRLHPLLAGGAGEARLDALVPVLSAMRDLGLGVLMDLVINHTAKDSPLVTKHPGWYKRDASGAVLSPSAIDPDDAEHVTVWGDLAEVDNEEAEDREGLWEFWETLVRRALDLGFSGFRCDAAYKVPAALWTRLIGAAKSVDPAAIFVAETLGCRLEESEALAGAGFHFFYNSSKWWDFEAPWCLEQHEQFRAVAPSIAFPESHDTPRLAAETGGNEAVQRQRYAFAAMFSAGVQITMGYEFGFRKQPHVVETRPEDWEEPLFDLTRFIRRVNDLKRATPLLRGEGVLRAADWDHPAVTVIERSSDDEAGTHRGFILVNRDQTTAQDLRVDGRGLKRPARLTRPCLAGGEERRVRAKDVVRLAPAEVALLMEA